MMQVRPWSSRTERFLVLEFDLGAIGINATMVRRVLWVNKAGGGPMLFGWMRVL